MIGFSNASKGCVISSGPNKGTHMINRFVFPAVLVAAVFVLGLSSCAPASWTEQTSDPEQRPEVYAEVESPCTDALFLELKGKALHEMTEREYEYFMKKDQECAEYQKAQMEVEPVNKMAEESSKWILVSLLITAASTVLILLTF